MLDTTTGQRRYRLGDLLIYRVGTYRQLGELIARSVCPDCDQPVLIVGNRDRLDDTAAPSLHSCA